MRISSIFLGLVLGVSLTATVPALAQRFSQLVSIDRERTVFELARLAAEADELARRALSNDALQRVELRRRATDLSARLRRLGQEVQEAPELERRGERNAPHVGPVAQCMSDGEFHELERVFDSASFSSGRLAVLHQAARGNHFSVAQVGQVMDWFMIDREKIDAAALLWPRVVDPERAFTLYEKLSFDSSQRELDERLRGAGEPRSVPALGARPYMSMR